MEEWMNLTVAHANKKVTMKQKKKLLLSNNLEYLSVN
jgi:hypothetical protein